MAHFGGGSGEGSVKGGQIFETGCLKDTSGNIVQIELGKALFLSILQPCGYWQPVPAERPEVVSIDVRSHISVLPLAPLGVACIQRKVAGEASGAKAS